MIEGANLAALRLPLLVFFGWCKICSRNRSYTSSTLRIAYAWFQATPVSGSATVNLKLPELTSAKVP